MEQIRVGEYLVERGIISEAAVRRILQYSAKSGLKFCEAALKLEIVSQESLIHAFSPDFDGGLFHLSPGKFPKACADLLNVEFILKYGVLPLGFKSEQQIFRTQKKILNIGLLDPTRQGVAERVEEIARAKFGAGEVQGTKIYLIFVDQYLEVLHDVYKIPEDQIALVPPSQLDGMLRLFMYTQELPQAA